jgi:hypothetical protein
MGDLLSGLHAWLVEQPSQEELRAEPQVVVAHHLLTTAELETIMQTLAEDNKLAVEQEAMLRRLHQSV